MMSFSLKIKMKQVSPDSVGKLCVDIGKLMKAKKHD